MVMTNNDQALADRIAQDMSDFIWKQRETFAGQKLPKVKDGVAQAIAAQKAGRTPIVVADHSDRTGNSTWILEELIRQGGRNFVVATIADDKAIQEIKAKARVGENVSVMVGGYADEYAGKPVKIEGTLEYLDKYQEHATVAVIKFGDNNRVVLTPVLHQVTTPEIIEDRVEPVRDDRHQVARPLLARLRRGWPGEGRGRHRRAGPRSR
jgi:microcystin degradation protein MlrC